MRRILLILAALPALTLGQAKPNIAVMDLAGSGLSQSDLITLSNRLRTELFETSAFTVVERGQMETILKEQGFQQSGCTDNACAVEVGQLLNVDRIILGSIDRISRVYSVNLRAVSVKDGAIVNSVKTDFVDIEVEELMLSGLRKAARRLAGLDTLEGSATPLQLRGRKVVKYKGYKGGEAGSLSIAAKPGDAEIFVDDSSYGKGSMIIDYVPAGRHRIRGERADYRKFREEAEVFANQETALNMTLSQQTPFAFSLGWNLFYRKALVQRRLIYHSWDGATADSISLDLNYKFGLPYSPTFSFGWEVGRNWIGFSGFIFPGFSDEVRFFNADRDTFNFETENPVYGGFLDYWRAVLMVPKVLRVGPGISLGYLKRQSGLDEGYNASSATDTLQYSRDNGDETLGYEYLFYGGPMLCLKVGYKHVFIFVTDRLLFGSRKPISSSSGQVLFIGDASSSETVDNSTEFEIENSLIMGLQFLF